MSARGSKIQVNVAELIKALEDEVARRKREHREALRGHPTRIRGWQKRALAALKEAERQVRDAKNPAGKRRWIRGGYEQYVDIPAFPAGPKLDTCGLESTIKALKAAAKPTVSLFPDEFTRYFPCRLSRTAEVDE